MRLKRIWAAVLVCAMTAVSIMGSYAQAAVPGAGTVSQAKSTQASDSDTVWASGPSKSSLSCESAIVMELSTGLILYKKNIHKQEYPASITKILTALLTVENCSNSEVVTFSETAAYGISAGDSTIYTEVGEQLTIEQCLYAIMLESANEVCLGVAEHISGSVSDFVDLMNARVEQLGLTDTHFTNPNGLPDTDHYTTAYDMAVIAREAMKNATFRKVTATKSYTMPKTNKHKKRYWRNHHQMINGYKYAQYEYKYCTGGKTGYTNAAKSTLVTYAEKGGMELVCVIMRAESPSAGEPNEYTDTTKLLNFAFENYQKYTVDEEASDINASLFNRYDSYFDAENSPVHLSDESSVVLPKGVSLSEAEQEITYYDDVVIETGDNTIGCVTYTYGGRIVGSTDIIYTQSEDSEEGQLDAATRAIVDSEIQSVRETEEKHARRWNFLKKIQKKVAAFLEGLPIRLMLLGLAGIVLLFLLALLLRTAVRHFSDRRERSSGGYRSKRGRRRYARRVREGQNRARREKRNVRRNRSRHYEQAKTPRREKKRRSKGVQYHKNHKRTKESFGKNFFDF